MAERKVDYLIVGQGLAGTWLAHYLLLNRKSVLVVDQFNPASATNVAAGIVNPITGRKLVKSWLFDSLFPFAEMAYRQVQDGLQTPFFANAPIVWLLDDVSEINAFAMRSTDPGYKKYIKGVKQGGLGGGFRSFKAHATVSGARVQLARFVAAYRKRLAAGNNLVEGNLECNQIELQASGARWKQVQAGKIIFCEGYSALKNPFFKWVPLSPAKGEVLLVKAPELETNGALVKRKHFVCPLGGQLFWVGSNYERNFAGTLPDVAVRDRLLASLGQMVEVPFELVGHQTAVRPTTSNRRPFMGLHPQHPQLGIFNGLGTKGASLAPFFAAHFADHLENQTPLLDEVDLRQHWKNGKET